MSCSEVLFTMAGSLFGRLSLEEGDSANSLEGLDIKLEGEGKNTGTCLPRSNIGIVYSSSGVCAATS